MKQKIIFNILLFLFFIEIVVVGYFIFSIIYPPVQFTLSSPLKVTSTEVKQGGSVPIELDYCKYSDVTPLTYFVIVDHDLLPAIPAALVLQTGCHKQIYNINIAYSVPVGQYRVSMIKQYPYLIFAGKQVTYFSNYFNITANTDEGTK